MPLCPGSQLNSRDQMRPCRLTRQRRIRTSRAHAAIITASRPTPRQTTPPSACTCSTLRTYRCARSPNVCTACACCHAVAASAAAALQSVIAEKRVTALCRCFASSKFPFCDGSHNKHNEATGDNAGPVVLKPMGGSHAKKDGEKTEKTGKEKESSGKEAGEVKPLVDGLEARPAPALHSCAADERAGRLQGHSSCGAVVSDGGMNVRRATGGAANEGGAHAGDQDGGGQEAQQGRRRVDRGAWQRPRHHVFRGAAPRRQGGAAAIRWQGAPHGLPLAL